LKADRKDIVLSGGGKILFLDLIFCGRINVYTDTEYIEEV